MEPRRAYIFGLPAMFVYQKASSECFYAAYESMHGMRANKILKNARGIWLINIRIHINLVCVLGTLFLVECSRSSFLAADAASFLSLSTDFLLTLQILYCNLCGIQRALTDIFPLHYVK